MVCRSFPSCKLLIECQSLPSPFLNLSDAISFLSVIPIAGRRFAGGHVAHFGGRALGAGRVEDIALVLLWPARMCRTIHVNCHHTRSISLARFASFDINTVNVLPNPPQSLVSAHSC